MPGVGVVTSGNNGSTLEDNLIEGLTVSSQITLIIACVGYIQGSGAPTGVDWKGSEDFTLLKRQREGVSTGFAVDIWELRNPTTGTDQVEVTLSAATNVFMQVYGLENADVNGTTFGDATLTGGTADTEGGASDPATVTASGFVTGALVIDIMTAATASTPSGSQTALYDSGEFGAQFGSSINNDDGVMSWTKDGGGTQHWAMAAVAVLPEAAGNPWYAYAQQ